MARSERFSGAITQALTVSTQTIGFPFDITNYSGFAATITCPAAAAGTMFLEWCNFNSTNDADWNAVPTAQYPTASVALAAATSKTVNVHAVHVGFLRLRVTLSAGAGTYTTICLAKDF